MSQKRKIVSIYRDWTVLIGLLVICDASDAFDRLRNATKLREPTRSSSEQMRII